MAKVVAVLAIVGGITAFLLGINFGGSIDPVRQADARYKDAQTDVYISQQAIDQAKAQNELDQQKRMNDVEYQYAPSRIENELYVKRIEAENWAKIRGTLATGIAAALAILALAFGGSRLIKTFVEIRRLPVLAQENPTSVPLPAEQRSNGCPSRRELYQAIQAQKVSSEWHMNQAQYEQAREKAPQSRVPEPARIRPSDTNK